MTRWTVTDRIVKPGQRCDHCGETGLKRTATLTSGDQTMNAGTGCAEKLPGYTRSRLNTAINRAEKERRDAWNAWSLAFSRYKLHITDTTFGPGLSPDSPSPTIRDAYHRAIADWMACRPEPPRPKEV